MEAVRVRVSLDGAEWTRVRLSQSLSWPEALAVFREVLSLPETSVLRVSHEGDRLARVVDLDESMELLVSVVQGPAAAPGPRAALPHPTPPASPPSSQRAVEAPASTEPVDGATGGSTEAAASTLANIRPLEAPAPAAPAAKKAPAPARVAKPAAAAAAAVVPPPVPSAEAATPASLLPWPCWSASMC